MAEIKNPRMATNKKLREELVAVVVAGSFQKRDLANDGLDSDELASLVEKAGTSKAGINDAYPAPSVTASAQYPVKQ